jgi:hypothetical protein
MTTHISEFAPANLPRIDYSTVDDDQAGHISEAMTLPENIAKYDVTFIPIDTPEARRAVAEEWAAYQQAQGDAAAKERGAFAVFSSRDESPEALERNLEEQLFNPNPRHIAVHALSKIVLKNPDASVYDLMRSYYEPDSV